jgi:transposase
MTKYSEKAKLDAVNAYFSGHRGLKATAEAHGVGFHSLRAWVAAYQAHGLAGIRRKPKKAYDAEFKLQVLERIRDEGLSYRQAGALFGVRRFDQIGAWERAFRESGFAGLEPGRGKTMKKKKVKSPDPGASQDDDHRSRQELLREVQQLRMENAYLKKLDALVQDRSKSARKKGR